jgi:16S rRNA processing protein RimM
MSEPAHPPAASLARIGRVGRTHGLRGEVNVDGVSLTPLELHAVKRFVWRRAGVAERVLTLETARPAHTRLLLRFAGFTAREQAAELVNGELWAEKAALPDPGPTTAYTFQLVGLRVETAEGRALGVIADVIATGAYPVYRVEGEREWLIPGPPEVVKRVDLHAGLMVVALPAGLEEL